MKCTDPSLLLSLSVTDICRALGDIYLNYETIWCFLQQLATLTKKLCCKNRFFRKELALCLNDVIELEMRTFYDSRKRKFKMRYPHLTSNEMHRRTAFFGSFAWRRRIGAFSELLSEGSSDCPGHLFDLNDISGGGKQFVINIMVVFNTLLRFLCGWIFNSSCKVSKVFVTHIRKKCRELHGVLSFNIIIQNCLHAFLKRQFMRRHLKFFWFFHTTWKKMEIDYVWPL